MPEPSRTSTHTVQPQRPMHMMPGLFQNTDEGRQAWELIVKKQLRLLAETLAGGGSLPDVEFPESLSPWHRYIVHKVADALRLYHYSTGEDPHRTVTVECRHPEPGDSMARGGRPENKGRPATVEGAQVAEEQAWEYEVKLKLIPLSRALAGAEQRAAGGETATRNLPDVQFPASLHHWQADVVTTVAIKLRLAFDYVGDGTESFLTVRCRRPAGSSLYAEDALSKHEDTALLGLLTGSGITLAMLRMCSRASTVGEEPFVATTVVALA
eukprot:gnl/TRDRNA2_/TRDRNA2_163692_c1_seq2.p1 gnl/TRDRNA2_/TRDRNA2_163692_c1~~gnl/TRDRNA2_/TRDRNA2_163692_c1_seq2.p1  ORF type:complete len:269 (+),score=30.35 gnl/TRDRNA2_/TRDRNA2_163692_c1_seq2:147-953(+)